MEKVLEERSAPSRRACPSLFGSGLSARRIWPIGPGTRLTVPSLYWRGHGLPRLNEMPSNLLPNYGNGVDCEPIIDLVAALRAGTGGALVVRGGPGRGKSALLAEAVALAAGLTVLRARGVAAEQHLPYGGLFDLLNPLLEGLSRIPPVQADALRGALSLAPAGPGDPFPIGVATLALLRASASESPVLVLVDDGHWLDAPSLAAVSFVARRLGDAPIGVIVALDRSGGGNDLSDLPAVEVGAPAVPNIAALTALPGANGHRTAGAKCRVMGRFAVTVDGWPIRLPGLAGRLVAYLAVRGSATVDELVDVFWPDDDPEQGRARLRKVVWRVRRQSEHLVVRRADSLGLDRGVEVDADRFAAAADEALRLAEAGEPAAGAARDALAFYGGELLPALRYDEWTHPHREALRSRYVALLDLLAVHVAARPDPDRAVRYLEQAITSQPYDEGRYLLAAEILLAAGRRGPALTFLERASRMMEELGLPPSQAVAEVTQRLRAG